MADIDLPLWSFPPNWADGVTERLSWYTDILTSRSGTEQRQAKRLSPRREFEFRINPTRNVRSYFDQWMHRISNEKCLLPLWHDISKLTAAADVDGDELIFATQYTEFVEGGLAMLYADPFTHEVVEIASITSSRLNLATPLTRAWPKGCTVYPLRRAWMDPEVRVAALTSRVGQATLGFLIDGANDYPAGVEPLPLFDGYPLVFLEPNRREDLETQFTRSMEEVDNTIGLIRRYDEVGRSFQTQFYNWTARGKEQHHLLRQAFYRLKGRQKAFWMPSFNDDVFLSRPLVAGENRLSIEQIGYTALGGAVEGRNRIMIYDDTGTPRVVTINGTSVGLGEGEERLNLVANSTFNAAAGRAGSFVNIMRLDNDVIEIQHHTDSMGVCEVGAACKSFANDRTNVGPFIGPDGAAVKNSAPCGVPFTDHWEFKLLNLPDRGLDNVGDIEGQMGAPAQGAYFIQVGLFNADRNYCAEPDTGERALYWDNVPAYLNTPAPTQVISNSPTELQVLLIPGGPPTTLPGCNHTGSKISVFYFYCRGPYWPGWRLCEAVRGQNGLFTSPSAADVIDGIGLRARLGNAAVGGNPDVNYEWSPIYLTYNVYPDYYNENWPSP